MADLIETFITERIEASVFFKVRQIYCRFGLNLKRSYPHIEQVLFRCFLFHRSSEIGLSFPVIFFWSLEKFWEASFDSCSKIWEEWWEKVYHFLLWLPIQGGHRHGQHWGIGYIRSTDRHKVVCGLWQMRIVSGNVAGLS